MRFVLATILLLAPAVVNAQTNEASREPRVHRSYEGRVHFVPTPMPDGQPALPVSVVDEDDPGTVPRGFDLGVDPSGLGGLQRPPPVPPAGRRSGPDDSERRDAPLIPWPGQEAVEEPSGWGWLADSILRVPTGATDRVGGGREGDEPDDGRTENPLDGSGATNFEVTLSVDRGDGMPEGGVRQIPGWAPLLSSPSADESRRGAGFEPSAVGVMSSSVGRDPRVSVGGIPAVDLSSRRDTLFERGAFERSTQGDDLLGAKRSPFRSPDGGFAWTLSSIERGVGPEGSTRATPLPTAGTFSVPGAVAPAASPGFAPLSVGPVEASPSVFASSPAEGPALSDLPSAPPPVAPAMNVMGSESSVPKTLPW